jgi:hypothetical protein
MIVAMKDEPDIFCPQCEWRPRAEDRWHCVPSCGMIWNTFWTRGVCPGCGIKWPKTQCHACGELSPHEHWYHYPSENDHDTSDADRIGTTV